MGPRALHNTQTSSPYRLSVPEAICTIGADQRVGTSGQPDQRPGNLINIVWAWESAYEPRRARYSAKDSALWIACCLPFGSFGSYAVGSGSRVASPPPKPINRVLAPQAESENFQFDNSVMKSCRFLENLRSFLRESVRASE